MSHNERIDAIRPELGEVPTGMVSVIEPSSRSKRVTRPLSGWATQRLPNPIALAPGHRLVVDDATLGMHSADELKAELERGVTRDASDFNPLKIVRPRK